MKRIILSVGLVVMFLIGNQWMAAPAAAEKPSWAGKEKSDRGDQKQDLRQDQKKAHTKSKKGSKKEHSKHAKQVRERDRSHQEYFNNIDRGPTDRYFAEQFRAGKCPPGLAKKGNGCIPPGQARKWTMNKPLPPDVIFHDLPTEVAVQLGPPPSGYRFVRVAQDILMIAVGTGMVVDAMKDIGRQME